MIETWKHYEPSSKTFVGKTRKAIPMAAPLRLLFRGFMALR
jgi:hypothetical protein